MILCNVIIISSRIPGEEGIVTDFFSFMEKTWELVFDRLLDVYQIKKPNKIDPIYETDNNGNDIQIGFCVTKWSDSDQKTGKSTWEQKWVSFKEVEFKTAVLPESIIAKGELAESKDFEIP
jgi:hypothetical protein